MRNIVVSLLVAVLFVPSLAAQKVKRGDTAILPFWREVEVVNLDPVTQHWGFIGDFQIRYGDTCQADRGGTVTVVGIDGDRVLVHFKARGEQRGVSCPTGTLFFTTKEKFLGMTAEAQKREKDFIKQVTEPALAKK